MNTNERAATVQAPQIHFAKLTRHMPRSKSVASQQETSSRKVGNSRYEPQLSVSHAAMLIDGNDEVFRHSLFLARFFAARLIMFLEVVGKQINLSGNQYVILLAIAHAQKRGGVTIREVARYALMAAPHVTTQAGTLIKYGLVQKNPNSDDGRSVLLSLTPKGEAAMNSIAPLRREFNDAFFVGITRQSMLAATKFLEAVTQNSEAALPLLRRALQKPAAKATRARKPLK